MKYIKKLVGKKCYLSPIFPEEADTIVVWFNDIVVTKYLPTAGRPYSLSKEKEILEKMAKEEHVYAIIDADLGRMIGIVGLHNIEHFNSTADLEIVIGEKEYWNRGYGEEASRLMLDFGFNILNLRNIMISVIDYNVRAYRCYEKIGFKEIGRRRQAYTIAGKHYDIIFMDLIRDDFEGSTLTQYFTEEYEEALRGKKLEIV